MSFKQKPPSPDGGVSQGETAVLRRQLRKTRGGTVLVLAAAALSSVYWGIQWAEARDIALVTHAERGDSIAADVADNMVQLRFIGFAGSLAVVCCCWLILEMIAKIAPKSLHG